MLDCGLVLVEFELKLGFLALELLLVEVVLLLELDDLLLERL